jgi:hypothetical protein
MTAYETLFSLARKHANFNDAKSIIDKHVAKSDINWHVPAETYSESFYKNQEELILKELADYNDKVYGTF